MEFAHCDVRYKIDVCRNLIRQKSYISKKILKMTVLKSYDKLSITLLTLKSEFPMLLIKYHVKVGVQMSVPKNNTLLIRSSAGI